MLSNRFAWLFFSISLFTACATSVKTVSRASISQTEITSGIILPYTYKLEKGAPVVEECTVDIKNLASDHHYRFDIHTGKDTVMASLLEGAYVFYRLDCQQNYWDMMGRNWSQFIVHPGKVSLLSELELFISEDRVFGVNYPSRIKQQEDSLAIWGLLSAKQQEALISGYTHKPITSKILETKWKSDETEVILSNGKTQHVDRTKFMTMKPCYHSEDLLNALWLGKPTATAKIKGGKVADIQLDSTNGTFSSNFDTCAKNQIEKMSVEKLPKGTREIDLAL